ncbi:DUF6497 family protein [Roseovarius aquimarinus]|uniref:DUF6497 family protein n=1 Tax=Roseovarius aquimarinus TaxID=1229156 RepID=A0ABW7I5X0_9RHOB
MADEVVLPSGAEVTLYETIGAGTAEMRLRYVSDGFDPLSVEPETLLDDMTFLCESGAVSPGEGEAGSKRVIVSIADRPADFGVLDTSVRQSFEAFTLDGDSCIWEAF